MNPNQQQQPGAGPALSQTLQQRLLEQHQSFTCDLHQATPASATTLTGPAPDKPAEVERALAEATNQALAVVTVTASTPSQSPQPAPVGPQRTAPTVVTQLNGDQPSTRLVRSDSLRSCVSVASLALITGGHQSALDEHQAARPKRAILKNRLHPGSSRTAQDSQDGQPSTSGRARSVAYNSEAKRAPSEGK